MAERRVVVIGAGVAGLVCALQLAHQGLQVTVIDQAPGPGGKLRQLEVDGAAIDSGPTVFTMRWVFDELFNAVGSSVDAELALTPLTVLARHHWADGGSLDLFADRQRSTDAVARFAGGDEARRFERFCDTARAVYRTLEGPYIRSPAPGMAQMMAKLGFGGLGVLASIGPMSSLWHSLGLHFRDPRLRQLFGRYATYCGSSPWLAPATLMLIAQVEMDGVWSVEGGMHALAQALVRLGRQRGVDYRFGTRAAQLLIEHGRARGVLLAPTGEGGATASSPDELERLRADAVVFNGDVAALRVGLLGEAARHSVPHKAPTRSLSALTWCLHAPTAGLALDRHNVFFQGDYASEFTDIFDQHRLPRQPTVYLCAQDRGAGRSPTGPERLLCLVNAPAVGDQDAITPKDIEQCERTSFDLLRRCGLDLSPQPHQVQRRTPADFHRRFPATGGALYGQATHGWMGAFSRPGSTTPIAGLVLAGGSVHPGPGVPMAAMSGRLAAEAVMASLASTRSSSQGAISGGTSMA